MLLPGCTSMGWREGVGFMNLRWGLGGAGARRGATRFPRTMSAKELGAFSKLAPKSPKSRPIAVIERHATVALSHPRAGGTHFLCDADCAQTTDQWIRHWPSASRLNPARKLTRCVNGTPSRRLSSS